MKLFITTATLGTLFLSGCADSALLGPSDVARTARVGAESCETIDGIRVTATARVPARCGPQSQLPDAISPGGKVSN